MESKNGFPKIRIQPDKLCAYLEIIPPIQSGLPCTREDVLNVLRETGINNGILDEQIEVALKENNWGKQILIAKGQMPTDGTDASLKLLFEANRTRVPQQDEKGNVDFHDLGIVNNVRRGQPLVERIPPVAGVNGIDVTGRELLPRTARDIALPRGKNTVCNEDNTILYAAIDGHIAIIEGKVHVQPVFELNRDVDFSSGNIDFIGDIIIYGNVTSGFSVKAEGDIDIRGFIEGADIWAGGSIRVKGGIKTGSKGFVKAGNNIQARFVENSKLEAGKDIFISEAIMQSLVRAGGSVVVSDRKATIVGGVVQASELVEAKILGSQLATQTIIDVGVNPYYREEYQAAMRTRTERVKTMENLNSSLHIYQRPGLNPQDLPDDKRKALIKMLDDFKNVRKEIAALEDRIAYLEQEFHKIQSARVRGTEIVYPGVRISIGSSIYIVNDAIKYSQFILDEGEIRLTSLR